MTAYKSARGKVIDMGTLSSVNEQTRAVGNMGVNARGDTLDAHNNVVKQTTARVNEGYRTAVNSAPKEISNRETIKPDELTEEEKEFENNDEDLDK
jgi:hypothetical protein